MAEINHDDDVSSRQHRKGMKYSKLKYCYTYLCKKSRMSLALKTVEISRDVTYPSVKTFNQTLVTFKTFQYLQMPFN